MLKFLTHKLKTHSLNDHHHHQDKAEDTDHDSGTESDEEPGDTEDPESIMESEAERSSGSSGLYAGSVTACSPYFLDSALPSDSDHNYDHHSSEEELEVINNNNSGPKDLILMTAATSRCGSVTVPEKRKWSQITGATGATTISSSLSCGNLGGAVCGGGSGSAFSSGGGRLTLSALGGSCRGGSVAGSLVITDHSSGSSDEEVQGLLAAMATPVQFRTSPPLDAHKPGRSLSPPPKLFHYAGQAPLDVSPRKRHRHTPRPPHVPRPCLDFEKMQQLKARAVTAWRHNGDHGGELSVYCS